MSDWLEAAQNWGVQAQPVYQSGDEAYIANKGYRFAYFSPYRPLTFVSIDCVLVGSTHEGTMFMYTKEALPTERVCRWQLIPMDAETWAAHSQPAAA